MDILKKVVHVVSFIIYFFILIYGLICLPCLFGFKPLVVLSGSMEPTFKTGSIIYYYKVNEDELKEGDIITFKSELSDKMISHRIESIEDGLYETKGDANNVPDAVKIRFSNIKGKDAKVSIPYVGYYIRFVNEHIIVVIMAVLILVSEFLLSNLVDFDNKKKSGSKREKKEDNSKEITFNEKNKEVKKEDTTKEEVVENEDIEIVLPKLKVK